GQIDIGTNTQSYTFFNNSKSPPRHAFLLSRRNLLIASVQSAALRNAILENRSRSPTNSEFILRSYTTHSPQSCWIQGGQSQRDCVIPAQGCEERATLGLRPRYSGNPESGCIIFRSEHCQSSSVLLPFFEISNLKSLLRSLSFLLFHSVRLFASNP